MLLSTPAITAAMPETNTMPHSPVPTIHHTHLATNWTELQKLQDINSTINDGFGWSVSLDGDTVLIGAQGDQASRGAVYVFTCAGTTWTHEATLTASDGQSSDGFGCAVSLKGDTALIGAPGDDSTRGAAYVFTRSGTSWTEHEKLVAFDGEADDWFGSSVSLDGDTLLIGSLGDDSSRGAAYVFTYSGTTWTQEAKLVASDGAYEDRFGCSVSLQGDRAVLGAPAAENYCGAAYIFTRTAATWTEQAKLAASDGSYQDYFGWSVSLDGATAVVGAPGDDYYQGAAYVYIQSGTSWTEHEKLVASDGVVDNWFGCSVSLAGDTLAVGAQAHDFYHGAAYVFTPSGTTWAEQAKLTASDGEANDMFGCSVTLHGSTAVVGAEGDDVSRGSAYVYMKESENQPPNAPTIAGPAQGKINVAIQYTFTATDPEGYQLSYYIDWGDETASGWIGPYASGEPIIQAHTWHDKGDYTIKAKAKDSSGDESDWAKLPVTMPASSEGPAMHLRMNALDRFPLRVPTGPTTFSGS